MSVLMNTAERVRTHVGESAASTVTSCGLRARLSPIESGLVAIMCVPCREALGDLDRAKSIAADGTVHHVRLCALVSISERKITHVRPMAAVACWSYAPWNPRKKCKGQRVSCLACLAEQGTT